MTEQTIEAPHSEATPPPPEQSSARRSNGALARHWPWAVVAVLLLAISLVLVVWARTRPGYDPYGWMVWGYQTLHLSLDLGGAPSWKPLPFVFDVPFALFGHYQLWLWMVSSVTISLAGAIFAGRIAYQLTARELDDEHRWPAIVAGVFARRGAARRSRTTCTT